MCDSKTIIYCGDLGVGGWHGIVFGIDGVCPGIPATNYKDATKIMVKTDVKAKSINNDRQCEQGGVGQFGCTYHEQGLSPTITAGDHGYCIGHILVGEQNDTDLCDRWNRRKEI